MKKNKLFLLLVASMLSFSSLVACGGANEDNSGNNNNNTNNSSANNNASQGSDGSSGQQQGSSDSGNSNNNNASSNNQGSSNNNTSSNNQGSSSNNNSSSNNQSNQFNPTGAKAILQGLAANGGYEVVLSATEGGRTSSVTFGEKGTNQWYVSGQNGYGFANGKYEQTDVTHFYSKSNNVWSYKCAIVDISDMKDALVDSVLTELTLDLDAIQAALANANGEKTSVNQREAYKYNITFKDEENKDTSAVVYIDAQYKICLKAEYSEGSFEITNFTTPAEAPFKNINVPTDFDVYATYTDMYSGKPINAPVLKAPNKFYVKYQQYKLNAQGEKKEITTQTYMKNESGSLWYYLNGDRTQVEQYEQKSDATGYRLRQGTVYSGSALAQWRSPADKTNDEFAASVDGYLSASLYIQYMKSEYAVSSLDKTIAGVACKAYHAEINTMNIMISKYDFWVDPNTNIVFYGASETIYNGSSSGVTVKIDVQEYSANLASFFDHACEQIVYREGDGNPKASDTHHDKVQGVVRVANCYEVGQIGTRCSYCGWKEVTSETELDPNNHVHVYDYWYDDGEGHHYKECSDCQAHLNVGNHECDESKKHATCSGKIEIECSVCKRRVEFDVEKSATHTYSVMNPVVDIDYATLASYATVSWSCDCSFLASWEREGNPGDDITWVMDLTDSTLFSYRASSYGYGYDVTVKKDACVAKIKTLFPNESDENIEAALKFIIENTSLNGYNWKFTAYVD